MRVLLISHTCQSRAEGQRKAEQLARLDDIDLLVLVPQSFNHFGVWRQAELPLSDSFQFAARKVRWPWLGPAQNYLHWYPDLAEIIRTFRPDIIDLWQEPWALVSAQACWLRNRLQPQAKIIMESEQNIRKRFPPPFSWLESYTFRNADYAVGRSSGVLRVLHEKGFEGPSDVVGNAVDTDLFHPMDRAKCKIALGISGFTVGYVGRLVERKGLMDMIDALPMCPTEITMVFVGDGAFRPALEKRLRALGRSDQVRFLPARKIEDLPQVMNALDALILPSWTVPTWKEQFGRVIIEAQACETPVIGSDSGAIPEVIDEGGLIFKERNPAALAAAIKQMKAHPEITRRMGKIGRRQVEENFTWRRVAVQMREIYMRCTERNARLSRRESTQAKNL
ncbi:MAG: glycosyltransferase family 4 protein [Verrucomicrobiota bacterium]